MKLSKAGRIVPLLCLAIVGCGSGVAVDPGNPVKPPDAAVDAAASALGRDGGSTEPDVIADEDASTKDAGAADVPPPNYDARTGLVFNVKVPRETISLGLDYPRHMVGTPRGLIFSTSKGALKMVVPGAPDAPTTVLPGSEYWGVTRDDKGRVYASRGSRIIRLGSDLATEEASWPTPEVVLAMTISKVGHIYWLGRLNTMINRTDTTTGDTRTFAAGWPGVQADLELAPGDRGLVIAQPAPVMLPISVTGDLTVAERPTNLGGALHPHGVAIDEQGNSYFNCLAGNVRTVVVVRPNGSQLDSLNLFPASVASWQDCTFGGIDRKTLYCTGLTGKTYTLVALAVNIPGKL
jgi:hypothetical protein